MGQVVRLDKKSDRTFYKHLLLKGLAVSYGTGKVTNVETGVQSEHSEPFVRLRFAYPGRKEYVWITFEDEESAHGWGKLVEQRLWQNTNDNRSYNNYIRRLLDELQTANEEIKENIHGSEEVLAVGKTDDSQ